MRLPRLTVAVASVVVLLDAASKAVVAHWLVAGRVVHVGPLLELDLYYNHAGARNVLTGRPGLVAGLAILAIAGLVAMAARTRSRGLSLGLGFLLGGGVGNLVDRLFGAPGPFRGGVIDWLAPFNSPGSMNLADLAINLGLLAIVLTVIRRSWTDRRGSARSVGPGTSRNAAITWRQSNASRSGPCA